MDFQPDLDSNLEWCIEWVYGDTETLDDSCLQLCPRLLPKRKSSVQKLIDHGQNMDKKQLKNILQTFLKHGGG